MNEQRIIKGVLLLSVLVICASCERPDGDGLIPTDSSLAAVTWQPMPDVVPTAPVEVVYDAAGCIDLLEGGLSILVSKLACEPPDRPLDSLPKPAPVQLLGTLQEGGFVIAFVPRPGMEVTGNLIRV